MGTIEAIIDTVMGHETGGKPDGGYTNDPTDPGGRTQYGISERSHPEAWKDGKVTNEEARAIYRRKYILYPGFDTIPSTHARLQTQLVDFGAHSGPSQAVLKLQGILGVEPDGILGPVTLQAVKNADPRLLNNQLVIERLRLIGRVIQKNPGQLGKLVGFINRACSFLL